MHIYMKPKTSKEVTLGSTVIWSGEEVEGWLFIYSGTELSCGINKMKILVPKLVTKTLSFCAILFAKGS